MHRQDVRYALRLLARSPGFTLLAVSVLAGGLGVSIFTFSFLYTSILRPLPLDEGDRVVRLTLMEQGRRRPVDAVAIETLRGSMRTVSELGGYVRREVLVGRDGERGVMTLTIADPILFTVARTPALIGRTLLAADAATGAEPVIVLSYRTWHSLFGADRSIVDGQVGIDGVSTRVVGIMPEGFEFPVSEGAWLPLPARLSGARAAEQDRLSLFGRLTPGATQAQAAAEATVVVQRTLTARGTAAPSAAPVAIAVESFPAAQIGDERTIVFACVNLLAVLILLLALVNVTTLLTARANDRVREQAVRLALGASTGRLLMQGMWESIILCAVGGIAGTAGAAWGLTAITRWTRANMADSLAFWWVWQVDRVTLVSAASFVILAIAVLGCVIVSQVSRHNISLVLQDASARAGSRHGGRLARVLVATQVAAVTVLLFVGVLAGVMAHRMLTIDPGYDPANLLQARLALSTDRFPTRAARADVYRHVQAQLAEHDALQGVLLRATLAGRDNGGTFAQRESQRPAPLLSARVMAILGTTSTLGIEVQEGRALEAGDEPGHPPVALISRSLASRHWQGRSPVGDQVRLAIGDGGSADGRRGGDENNTAAWRTIVGVVSDVPYGNLLSRDRSADAIYVPLLQADVSEAEVLVRSHTAGIAGRQALHQAFGAVDPLLVPREVYRATEVIERAGQLATASATLLRGCFAFALVLAVTGTYGLMSRTIGLRTREIGVRRALGATDAMTTRLLLTQGARQLGVGTLAAAPIVMMVGATATYLLPLSGALTAAVGTLVSVAIVAVVLAVTWLPTRKVLRVPLRDALSRD